MKVFYVTFGLGSVLGGNYMVAWAPDEETLRIRLNADKLPWSNTYTDNQFDQAIGRYNLQPLAKHYEAVSKHNSGPCEAPK